MFGVRTMMPTMTKVRTAVRLAVEGDLIGLMQGIQREIRHNFIKCENTIARYRYKDSYADPTKIIYIDPDRIDSYLLMSSKTDFDYQKQIENEVAHLYDTEKAGFRQRINAGRILAGDWDQHTRSWDNHLIYQSFVDVYRNGKDWVETEWVQAALKRIDAGYSSYGYSSKKEFLNNRIPYLEQLYDSLNKEGYLTQKELEDDHRTDGFFHEIGVNIGRNGEIIYNNRSGQNRLSFAKLLGLDRIPVIVIVRHEEWQKTRARAANSNFADGLGEEGQQVKNHPDMADLIDQDTCD